MNENREIVLSVKDLVVKFNLRGQVLTALRGITMDLYKGESLAIVGESGSGKSVFCKNFMGLPTTALRQRQRRRRAPIKGRITGII